MRLAILFINGGRWSIMSGAQCQSMLDKGCKIPQHCVWTLHTECIKQCSYAATHYMMSLQ